jgi:hypothetical protein
MIVITIENKEYKDFGHKTIRLNNCMKQFLKDNPDINFNKLVNDALEKHVTNDYHYIFIPIHKWVVTWFCPKCKTWNPATSEREDRIKMRKSIRGWCRVCKKLFRLYSRSKNGGFTQRFQIKFLKGGRID